MKDIRIIRDIPPRIKEVRPLNELAMDDMEEGMIEGQEDETDGHLTVYHPKIDEHLLIDEKTEEDVSKGKRK